MDHTDLELMTERAIKNSLETTIQDVLDLLEADDGKSFEEKKAAAIALLNKSKEPCLSEVLVDLAAAEITCAKIKNAFWSQGPIVCEAHGITLRKVEEIDRDGYLTIQRDYAVLKSMLKESSYCDLIWNEHIEPKALILTIEKNGQYIGYCGVKNTSQKPWEIVIEILRNWTGQGIGIIAITEMMKAMSERLGVTEFRVRIDPANKPSQKMFEKLGAVPNGVSEFLIHDQDALEKLEEDNSHMIDADIEALAMRFNVEPRVLLSHVLEYSLRYS